MRIEIDVDRIVKKIDVVKIIEEKIMSDILDNSKLECVVDDIFESDEMKNFINIKVVRIVEEYLSSEKGKKFIIEKFECAITDSDVLIDDKIIELVADFLKKSLMERR